MFSIDKAIALEELEKNSEYTVYIQNRIIEIEDIFEKNENIILSQRELELFLNGVKIGTKNSDGIYKIYDEKQTFIGLGEVNSNRLKRDVVI
ncbi:MAG: hypothetical protein HFJ23_04025 [Clostridia bacterium]|nr:hypothetical protein [Clostridia bacterium]